LGRLARQVERVAHEVGDVLDFRRLIIVREDDCVLLPAEPVDLGLDVEQGIEGGRGHGPLGRRHDSVDHCEPVSPNKKTRDFTAFLWGDSWTILLPSQVEGTAWRLFLKFKASRTR